jgi:predicted transposase YbfD/YdcC
MLEHFRACFAGLRDPRSGHAERHDLAEILILALCAVLSGGQTAVDMAVYAEAKRDFLSGFLDLKHGIPSHDTFSRVFRLLDPDQFRACFQRFTAGLGEGGGRVIAIDGKTVRRRPQTSGRPLHMVSAWDCEHQLVLAQIATDIKGHEIAAVSKLLKMLYLKGAIVTADAHNCQRSIAARIVGQGGDYALALKPNHGVLHAQVKLFLDGLQPDPAATHTTITDDHGRFETRTSLVSTDVEWLQQHHRWPGLAAIGKVARVREVMAKPLARTTTDAGYYLLSLPLPAARFGEVVRSHWGVENRLHWPLNAVMNEDLARSSRDNSPYNLAILRHMALNLMRRDDSRVSLRGKFNLAGWQDSFLTKLLRQAGPDRGAIAP